MITRTKHFHTHFILCSIYIPRPTPQKEKREKKKRKLNGIKSLKPSKMTEKIIGYNFL